MLPVSDTASRPVVAFVFTSADTWWSRIIRFFTWSKYSHCGVYVAEPGSNPVIYQAWAQGVTVEAWSSFLSTKRRVRLVIDSKWDMTPAVAFCKAQLGKGYAWRSNVLDALEILRRDVGLSSKPFATDPNQFNCSQLLAGALAASHYPGAAKLGSDVTPEDVAELLLSHREWNITPAPVSLSVQSLAVQPVDGRSASGQK